MDILRSPFSVKSISLSHIDKNLGKKIEKFRPLEIILPEVLES